MPIFVFSPVMLSLTNYKTGVYFMCNSLPHRNKRLFISGQVFRKSSWNLVQNEKDYSLALTF